MVEIMPYKERTRLRSSLPTHCEHIVSGGRLRARRGLPPDAGSSATSVLDFLASKTARSECLVFKLPSLWCFCGSSPSRHLAECAEASPASTLPSALQRTQLAYLRLDSWPKQLGDNKCNVM